MTIERPSSSIGRRSSAARRSATSTASSTPSTSIEQHGELVAALASGDVAGPDCARQPLGDLDQQPVAGSVAQRIVDDLEVVEVKEQQCDVRSAAAPACHRSLDVVA